MLETRLPVSSVPSALPIAQPRRGARLDSGRAAHAEAAPVRPARPGDPAVARPAVSRRAVVSSRLARSEARMLALAVSVTSLMCAVLVVYLAAYAHVTQLGLEQDMAKRQLAQVALQNQLLQVDVTKLQDRSRIIGAARNLHMVLYTGPIEYIDAGNGLHPPTTLSEVQGANDASPSAGGATTAVDH